MSTVWAVPPPPWLPLPGRAPPWFAAVTTAGLVLGPALWSWIGGGAVAARTQVWGVRLAGVTLAAASGWALTHGVWASVAAYCFS